MLKTVGNPSTRYGDQTIVNGNLVIATAGKGIDFTANGGDILSQYDEGTWTPAFINGTFTLSAFNRGYYTRVGRQVTASALMIWSAVSGSGDLQVKLPVASGLQFARYGGSFGTIKGVDNNGGAQLLLGNDSGTDYATVRYVVDNGDPVSVNVANLSAAGEIHFTITYFV